MSSDVTLSAATRQNLLSLQDTSALTATTQNRLATGKKVASALDNPLNFFTAQSLTGRSKDISSLLDGISNGVQTIQAANQGITSIQKIVDQAKSLTSQALATQITTTGTAATALSTSSLTSTSVVNFFVNGTQVSASGFTSASSIVDVVSALNAVSNAQGVGNAFSIDSTGKKVVLNASADIEFADTASQTTLGFSAGTGTGPTYGTASAAAGTSSEITVSGVTQRASLASQYNNLLIQITQLAGDASFNGVNLISGKNNDLTINFNPKGNSNLTVASTDETASGLGLSAITEKGGTSSTIGQGSFLLNADIKSTAKTLESATDQLKADATTLGSNLSVVQNRQDFSKQIANILDTGSANLTNADLNEEAANSQALSTRQSLGISALSLANTAQQSILQLLR
ncbi:flagellin [Methylobacterium sp. sgz302541]|uniref:flagellin N-terminal helical domain-containing protein n=1 Tax=unclassified Methylobacterium TaxID=2615210 RepID=UPI003D34CAC5